MKLGIGLNFARVIQGAQVANDLWLSWEIGMEKNREGDEKDGNRGENAEDVWNSRMKRAGRVEKRGGVERKKAVLWAYLA
jgi:hypothetical protein